ncbi:MAG: hypothetical protein WD398_00365 [Cyclobacteriaceae bacterium]
MMLSRLLFVIALPLFLMSCEGLREDPPAQPLLKGYHITAIAFDGQGIAWLGTLNQGLIRFDGQNKTVYPEITGMIRAIKVDSQNQVYLATDGLVKFDGENFTRYDATYSPSLEGNVFALDIDSKDRVWFAMGDLTQVGWEGWMAMDYHFIPLTIPLYQHTG